MNEQQPGHIITDEEMAEVAAEALCFGYGEAWDDLLPAYLLRVMTRNQLWMAHSWIRGSNRDRIRHDRVWRDFKQYAEAVRSGIPEEYALAMLDGV